MIWSEITQSVLEEAEGRIKTVIKKNRSASYRTQTLHIHKVCHEVQFYNQLRSTQPKTNTELIKTTDSI
ncbi:hypothetical protein Trydic_g21417 [Trypoxylus dichotomus]